MMQNMQVEELEERIKQLEVKVEEYKQYWTHPQWIFDERNKLKAEIDKLEHEHRNALSIL